MSRKIAVVGGGGLAKEIIEVLRMNGDEVYGIFAKESSLAYPHFGYLEELALHKDRFDGLIVAVGAVNKEGMQNRRKIIEFVKKKGMEQISVLSPAATISPSVQIGKGVYVGHGVLISCDAKIEDNVLVNHYAVVGHDACLEENASIAPQVFLGGGVHVEKDVMIGAAATVRQGIRIGRESLVGMRAIVVRSVKENSTVMQQISKVYRGEEGL